MYQSGIHKLKMTRGRAGKGGLLTFQWKKQINLINTFEMTMIFPFSHFLVIFDREKDFLGDLDLVQNKSLPNSFVTRKHYKTRYYMILCDFYL